MSVDREYRIRISTVADNAGTDAAKKGIDEASNGMRNAEGETRKLKFSNQALNAILHQVGESSKRLQIGLMALSAVMTGSVLFGVQAVVQGVRLLINHFQEQKDKAIEAARATVAMWEDTLQANTDAREAVDNYNQAIANIIKSVDTLKQKESEEESVLKRVLEARLKILEAMRQAELGAAKGNKEEEARINERYSRRQSDVELENEQAEIDLKKRQLARETSDAKSKEAAFAAAAKAKGAGAPGRTEAREAEEALAKLEGELHRLQAARMKPEDLAKLRAEVEADVQWVKTHNQAQVAAYAATGVPMGRVKGLQQANQAEEAYSAAQQEYEQRQAVLKRYTDATKKLAKDVEEAEKVFKAAVDKMRGTQGEISTAEAAHKVNVDVAKTVHGVKDKAEIEGAGGRYNPASQTILHMVRAIAGTAEGGRMSTQETAYFNNLLAAARGANKENIAKSVIAELVNMHVDENQKWADLQRAIQEIRRGQAQQMKQLRSQSAPP